MAILIGALKDLKQKSLNTTIKRGKKTKFTKYLLFINLKNFLILNFGILIFKTKLIATTNKTIGITYFNKLKLINLKIK